MVNFMKQKSGIRTEKGDVRTESWKYFVSNIY